MVSIRLRFEITTPPGQRVEGLPELPRELMVSRISEIPTFFEKIKVNRETYDMKTIGNPHTGGRVGFCLFPRADNFPYSHIITILVDVVKQPGEEPSE